MPHTNSFNFAATNRRLITFGFLTPAIISTAMFFHHLTRATAKGRSFTETSC